MVVAPATRSPEVMKRWQRATERGASSLTPAAHGFIDSVHALLGSMLDGEVPAAERIDLNAFAIAILYGPIRRGLTLWAEEILAERDARPVAVA